MINKKLEIVTSINYLIKRSYYEMQSERLKKQSNQAQAVL